MENNEKLEEATDIFGNVYTYSRFTGELKFINGTEIFKSTNINSNADNTKKDGWVRTMLIEIKNQLTLYTYGGKKLFLEPAKNNYSTIYLIVDRNFKRLHGFEASSSVKIKENGNEIKKNDYVRVNYHYRQGKRGEKTNEVTYISRSGLKPIIADNVGEGTFAEFFDVNKNEYYKGIFSYNIQANAKKCFLTKYHKIGVNDNNKDVYNKDLEMEQDFTGFCYLDKENNRLYLLDSESASPKIMVLNLKNKKIQISKDLSYKYRDRAYSSLLANELSLKTLEPRIEENERRNKFWNDKVQKIRNSIKEPLDIAKKPNNRCKINQQPTTITLDKTKKNKKGKGNCNIF